jgi:hypothetical protein
MFSGFWLMVQPLKGGSRWSEAQVAGQADVPFLAGRIVDPADAL